MPGGEVDLAGAAVLLVLVVAGVAVAGQQFGVQLPDRAGAVVHPDVQERVQHRGVRVRAQVRAEFVVLGGDHPGQVRVDVGAGDGVGDHPEIGAVGDRGGFHDRGGGGAAAPGMLDQPAPRVRRL